MKVIRRIALIAILNFLFCVVQCSVVVLPDVVFSGMNTTTRTEMFVYENQRLYTNNVETLQLQLNEFKKQFNNNLKIMAFHDEYLETKLAELENKLHAMEILDDLNNHCVQSYRHRLPMLATIRTNLAACSQKGSSAYASIVGAADGTLKAMRTYYSGQMTNSLVDCKKKYEKLEANYTACVITVVKSLTTTMLSNSNTFKNQMKTSACSANTKMKEVFDCYSAQVFSTISILGEVNALYENCAAGNDLCPSCGDEDTIKGRCPYQMSWHLSNDDLAQTTITNPFKEINKNTPCLQINFIKNTQKV